MLRESVRQSLRALLGRRQVVTDPAELIAYEVDAGLDRGSPEGVVFPQSTEDVVRLVRWAGENDVPLIARGAGTGLSGGAVAEHGGVVVGFSRMDRVLELDESGRSAVVEPGVVNLRLDELVKTKGLYYPPDPASGRSCTIGGNVAENAGGPHCFKYGVTTNYVTGLEVVLADGRIVRLGGRALDYPEYDLCGLLTGSEGTLGIATQISVRLIRNPSGVKTMMAVFDSVEQAGIAVSAVIAGGLVPATMEMMDQKIARIIEDYAHAGLPTDAGAVLIIEVDGYPASLDPQMGEVARILRANGGRDLRIAVTADERDKIWYARKSAAGAMTRLAPAYYLVDGTVPRSRLAATLAAINGICDGRGLRVGYVFHAGDGNLHPLILMDDPSDQDLMDKVLAAGREIVERCIGQGGSITGEHGVGIEKRIYMPLMYSAAELSAMQDVKDVFDTKHLLNPGKVLPAAAPPGCESLPAPAAPAESPFVPTSTEEAAAAVRAWAAAGRQVRIRGGGTKSSTLPEADVLLSTRGLSGIRTYAPDDLFVTAGAGTPLGEVQAFLARDGMQVPLASPWPAATVGGTVAANVNGPLRMRYGGIRDLVLALTLVQGDGRMICAGRPVVKNVAGYDLPKVMVGAHGTLGLIADVTLKLTPLPRARRTLLVPIEDRTRGLALAGQMLPLALVASALILCKDCAAPGVPQSQYLLVYSAEGWPEDVASELAQVREVLRAAGAAEPLEVEAPSGTDLWADFLRADAANLLHVRVGVPPKDLSGYVQAQAAGLETGAIFADVASGLVYAASSHEGVDEARSWLDTLRRPALAAGGYAVVMAAPEGWQSELHRWGYRPSALDVMRGLKARWDPAGCLNPGAFVVDQA